MPQFIVTSPDGKRLRVNAPEGATQEQAVEYAKKQMGGGEEPSTLGDMATSFGRGVAKGTIGLAGLPGDIASGLNKGIDYLTGQTPPQDDRYSLGTTEELTKPVEKAFGKFQEPKTTAGRYAQSVGEFLPSSVIGPGGKLMKAATTLGGGLGAEAGGEYAGEPGRFVGGLAGGAGAGLAGAGAKAATLPKQILKDQPEIKQAAKMGFKAVENSGVLIPKPLVDGLHQTVRDMLKNESFRDFTAPSTFQLVDELKLKGNATIGDIMSVREALNKIHPAVSPTDAEAARQVKGELDSFLGKLASKQGGILKTAQGNWGASKKLEELQKAQDVAGHRASVSGTGTNEINTMRQEIRKILDSDKRVRGYRPDERAQMEKIIEGTLGENFLRKVSRLEPGGGMSTWGSLLTALFNAPLAIAGAGAGFGARKLGDVLSRRQISDLVDMVKQRAPVNAPYADRNAAIKAQQPNYGAIVPAAATRSAMDVLANPGQDGLE